MTIYLPKTIVPLIPTVESPLFFLAGPIRGGGDWQAFMADQLLLRKPSALVACPSRWDESHTLSKYFHQPFTKADNRQLVWERHYLKQAGLEANVPGCVIFWLGRESKKFPHPGPESYAMDTRREIGKFIAYLEVLQEFPELSDRLDTRIVVGGHPNFYGLDVILFELSAAIGKQFPFYKTMTEVVEAALRTARKSKLLLSNKKPKLVMTYHNQSGRFFIRNEDNYLLKFPTRNRIYKIWKSIFPNTDFFIGSEIAFPTIAFYADVGKGTNPKNRQKFCDALAAECSR